MLAMLRARPEGAERILPSYPNIDAALVARLVAQQFPHWAGLPIRPVASSGWDNRTFHLGEHMLVRLPSAASYALQAAKEQHWLPKLAPLLPLPIPVPLAMGVPSDLYRWHWSIYQWLDGEAATLERIADLPRFATDLARFLVALQQIDAGGGPPAGAHNFFRGGPVAVYDGETRQSIEALAGRIDADAATAAWDAALATRWQGLPVWFHGDVAAGNLLVKDGQLSAVIDFGTSGVGDPACDLAIAWTLFEEDSREAFRSYLPLDKATWARGRGWALWKALIVLAKLPGTNPDPVEIERSRHVLDEVLADHKLAG
jgi:aminoglycoside phosphotransferase (APT) family kinase protein